MLRPGDRQEPAPAALPPPGTAGAAAAASEGATATSATSASPGRLLPHAASGHPTDSKTTELEPVLVAATAPASEETGEGVEDRTVPEEDETVVNETHVPIAAIVPEETDAAVESAAVSREIPQETVESKVESMHISQEPTDISQETGVRRRNRPPLANEGPMIMEDPATSSARESTKTATEDGTLSFLADRSRAAPVAPFVAFGTLGGMVAALAAAFLALAVYGRRRRWRRRWEEAASVAATEDLGRGGTFDDDEASLGDDPAPPSPNTPPSAAADAEAKSIASNAGRWLRRGATSETDATSVASNLAEGAVEERDGDGSDAEERDV